MSKSGAPGIRKGRKDDSSGDKLKAKEEEYRRLNAELEAKTSELVKEADELLQGNFSIISKLEAKDVASPEASLLIKAGDPSTAASAHPHTLAGKRSGKRVTRALTSSSTDYGRTSGKLATRPATSALGVTKERKAAASGGRASTAVQGTRGGGPPTQGDGSPGLDPDLLATIRRLEMAEDADLASGECIEGVVAKPARVTNYEDLLPPAMEDMGSEATIRFLKAKLRVMQEEMDSLCQDYSTKDKLVATQEVRIKELEAAKSKLEKSIQNTNNQMAKHKKAAEELKQKCDGLEAQLASLRKDYDALKLSQKKASSQHGAMDVRLNRALEEVERYKMALQSTRNQAKEDGKVEREKNEQLSLENRRMEKQKSELMAGFKKQMKLIDILKRQKMHIEAAKLLSFAEDEFMKALDWGGD